MTPEANPIGDTQRERVERRVATLVAGRWYLESVLGIGGMAAVYKAVHHRNGRRVAVKILHDELVGLDDVRERFYLEAYAANRVAHRGAVPALDDGELPDGTPFLVMEYLEGETLDERWRRSGRHLPLVELTRIMERLLDVLIAAHAKGIVHRDIKPENVFLTQQGGVRLLDFGIAHVRSRFFPTQTRAGAVMGTPAFMPPEQARGRWDEVDHRSDLFAVAASLYTLVSGKFLHEAETSNEYLLAAMTRPPAPIREVAPHLPQVIAEVIDRGVAFEKSDRFASARAMRQALANARRSLTPDDEQQGELAEGELGSSKEWELPETTHQAVIRTQWTSPPNFSPYPRLKWGLAAAVVVSACLGFLVVNAEQWGLGGGWTPLLEDESVEGLVLNSSMQGPLVGGRGSAAAGRSPRELRLSNQPIFDEQAVLRSVGVEANEPEALAVLDLEAKTSNTAFRRPARSTSDSEPGVLSASNPYARSDRAASPLSTRGSTVSEELAPPTEEAGPSAQYFDPLARRR